MNFKLEQLYGYPVGIANIDKNLYDKKTIIQTIENNFKKDKKRNKWSDWGSLHHSYNDKNNPNQEKVDFKSLYPLYRTAFKNYFKSMFKVKKINYDMQIVNYTCMEESNYMGEHTHNSIFNAVHYIQFDEKNHTPTCFINPYSHAEYFGISFYKDFNFLLDEKDTVNSWAFKDWQLYSKEDEMVITPGVMKHKVNPQKSKDKNRITIVININSVDISN